ncbi:MAG TPA: hypothetical protein EYP17_05260, partial [Candidatus Latescibacteria bacterium]|nr:hypothetical protein [Candidatus Latescibacterota bacterium]
EKGGDLGYWREGEVIGATAQKVFSMEVGEISEPFRDPQGYYHVIEVLDRRPVGFETQKPTIVNRLKVQKLEGVYREYMEGLKEELGLKVEPDVADWLIERLRELGGELEGFSDEERRKVLVRYDEEEVSLGEYLKWLASLRPGPRRLSDSSWVARSVERFTLDNILVPHAAHREEIDRSEWLRSHLKKRLEDMMITELKRQEVDRKVINPEAVRKYYESHKDIYYRRPPRVLIRGILLDSLRWAQEAYEKVRAGASMAEVAGDYPPFHGKYRNYDQFTLDITEESEKHMGVPLIELVSRAEIGKINEPIRLSFVRDGRLLTGYAVVRVLKREPAGFEPLETPWVLRDIERKIGIVESKRLRELYNQWLTELRVKYNDKITIYQDRLKAVELAE